jgi:hypothetical protein
MIAVLGCARAQTGKQRDDARWARYGDLPGLSATAHAGLRDELARLESERATPALLAADQDASAPADDDNAAVVIRQLFAGGTAEWIDGQIAAALPPFGEELPYAVVAVSEAAPLRHRYQRQQVLARVALSRPACSFGVRHMEGLAADTTFVEAVRIGARLEAILAAELLAAGEIEDAAISVENMFRLIALAAREKHLVPRLAAADMRGEAIAVLAAVARHRDAGVSLHARLYALLVEQLAAWPADADAWIGDRALGLHTYELVRDGHFASLLTSDELAKLQSEGRLDALLEEIPQTVDADEHFYLAAMRQVIAACDRPFHLRVKLLDDIESQLAAKHGTSEFPTVAATILLPKMRRAHERLARDRALCEGWALALAMASGLEPPSFPANPVTGSPYVVRREEARVTVEHIGGAGETRAAVIEGGAPPPRPLKEDRGGGGG